MSNNKLDNLLEEEFSGEFDSDNYEPITESDEKVEDLSEQEEEEFTADDEHFRSTPVNFTTE